MGDVYNISKLSGIEDLIRYIIMAVLIIICIIVIIKYIKFKKKDKISKYIIFILVLAIIGTGEFYVSSIINKSVNFIDKLNDYIQEIHKNLTGQRETITLRYEPSVREDEFATQIVMSEQKDLFTGTTNIGPHRDDLSFVSEGIDFREYGSRGQKRTAALSLKLTEIKIVEEKKGEKPILLLDDVLSELDRNRQNYLLEHIKGIQTIITCTGLEEFVKNGINIQKTFEIESGKVKR